MRRQCVVMLIVAVAAALPTAAEQPNVVVLFVDDLGYRDIGVYGGPVETPALDALAANGVRFADLPKDREGMQALFEQVKAVLEETNDPALSHGDLWTQMFNGFDNKAAERLRIQFIRLNEFRESWIPTLKAGGFRQFQLFNLDQDITQRTDISRDRPEVFETLKQALLEIHASVMLDGPDWHAPEIVGDGLVPSRVPNRRRGDHRGRAGDRAPSGALGSPLRLSASPGYRERLRLVRQPESR